MEKKKYKLTSNFKMVLGVKVFQIEALIDFGSIKKGELGGYIEKKANLSVYGDASVSGNASVFGDACVYGDASVFGDASVSGDARVYGNAWVSGDASVYGNARVSGNASVSGDARVSGNASVYGELELKTGYSFGVRHNNEEIKYERLDDNSELIYKGDDVLGEEDKHTITIDGKEIELSEESYQELKDSFN